MCNVDDVRPKAAKSVRRKKNMTKTKPTTTLWGYKPNTHSEICDVLRYLTFLICTRRGPALVYAHAHLDSHNTQTLWDG